jgi:hypothetical protein
MAAAVAAHSSGCGCSWQRLWLLPHARRGWRHLSPSARKPAPLAPLARTPPVRNKESGTVSTYVVLLLAVRALALSGNECKAATGAR